MSAETGERVYDRCEMPRATPTQRKNRAQLLRDVEHLSARSARRWGGSSPAPPRNAG